MGEPTLLVVQLKAIASPPSWSAPDDTGYMWFNAPLEIGGVVEPLLVLHGGCYAREVERHVTLELRLSKTPGRRIRPLERIDWKSVRGGHSNPRRRDAPEGFYGTRVPHTHLHAFELNWLPVPGRFRHEDLPYADEITEDLPTFSDLLRYAGKRFRISNINLVSRPPWEYRLELGDPV